KATKLDEKPPQEAVDWAKYGFDPGVDIEIGTDQNQRETFKVSDTSAYDGSFYIQKNGELLLAERSMVQITEKNVKHVPSHQVWRKMGEVTEIVFNKKSRLKKTDKGWTIQPEMDLPLSDAKVRDWLDALRDFRAMDLVIDPTKVKALKPAMTVDM